ncbi:MAG TPA: DUF2461 domain-containing protein [Polyangiaceae bacterium]
MTDRYFSAETLKFLTALTLNNHRTWFEEHKGSYEALVREPALRLIGDFAPTLKRISRHLTAVDKKVGGSLMRIHRDTRFSGDKSPFKTNIGIQFRHVAGKDIHAPGLYFHIAPDECFVAAGIWHPDPETLSRIRGRIVEKPRLWHKASRDPAFRDVFELGGESLARPPRGVSGDHPDVEDLKRKDHIAAAPLTVRELSSPKLLEILYNRFSVTAPYVRFLCDAVELPF